MAALPIWYVQVQPRPTARVETFRQEASTIQEAIELSISECVTRFGATREHITVLEAGLVQ